MIKESLIKKLHDSGIKLIVVDGYVTSFGDYDLLKRIKKFYLNKQTRKDNGGAERKKTES